MPPSRTPRDAPSPPRPPDPPVFKGKRLFPFQAKAAEAIAAGRDVIVAAPTGAGKTLVADIAIDQALKAGRRVVYTSPIKALSNQKFRDFREEYGEERVGIMTGDVTINGDAPLLIMTTEIFRNTIFEAPERMSAFEFVVFDEVHYIDDLERGTVWEESIIYAPPHVRIVALSATVPNVDELAGWIEEVRETRGRGRRSRSSGPVPLIHKLWVPARGPRGVDEVQARGARAARRAPAAPRAAAGEDKREARGYERALDEATGHLLAYLTERELLPALYFVFSRKDCERLARAHAGLDLLRARRARAHPRALRRAGRRATRSPTRRARASCGGSPRAASSTTTRGCSRSTRRSSSGCSRRAACASCSPRRRSRSGVNMPARTVCFHALRKFDGVRVMPLRVRDYWQMAGRAGRQGIDEVGHVFAILDERYVDWREIERLHDGRMEPVRSRFNLDYSTILNLYARIGERVADAWRRSFARYHATHGRKAAGRRDSMAVGAEGGAAAKAIERRLDVLREFHYLDAKGPTRKGRIAAQIAGYEIACTEAYEGGFLAPLRRRRGRDPLRVDRLRGAAEGRGRSADPQPAPARARRSWSACGRSAATKNSSARPIPSAFRSSSSPASRRRGPRARASPCSSRWARWRPATSSACSA